MARITEHPFLVGLAITLLVIVTFHLLPAGPLGPAGIRGMGLVVLGGSLAVLIWKGLDRGDVFWFFLGGVCGLILSLPIVL
jgi:hypothetical protein